MKVDPNVRALRLRNEDGHEFVVRSSNRGEPFRQGIEMDLTKDYDCIASVFLEDFDAKLLRDFLNKRYPVTP